MKHFTTSRIVGGLTIVAIASVVIAVGIFAPVSPASAISATQPFGGKVAISTACTCDPGTFHIEFAKPYYDPFPLQVGSLDYSVLFSPINSPTGLYGGPGTFEFYKPTIPPGIYDLGSYVPGVQACYMLTPTPNGPHCELAGTGVWAYMGISSGFINAVGSSLIPAPTL